jgi:hypothetical protein
VGIIIDIQHHFIQQHVAYSEIDLAYCSTKDIIANIFTKQLPQDAFEKFRKALSIGKYQKISLSGSDDN